MSKGYYTTSLILRKVQSWGQKICCYFLVSSLAPKYQNLRVSIEGIKSGLIWVNWVFESLIDLTILVYLKIMVEFLWLWNTFSKFLLILILFYIFAKCLRSCTNIFSSQSMRWITEGSYIRYSDQVLSLIIDY